MEVCLTLARDPETPLQHDMEQSTAQVIEARVHAAQQAAEAAQQAAEILGVKEGVDNAAAPREREVAVAKLNAANDPEKTASHGEAERLKKRTRAEQEVADVREKTDARRQSTRDKVEARRDGG